MTTWCRCPSVLPAFSALGDKQHGQGRAGKCLACWTNSWVTGDLRSHDVNVTLLLNVKKAVRVGHPHEWIKNPTMHHQSVTENSNVQTCAHFCYKMVHLGIFDKCIAGFVRLVYSLYLLFVERILFCPFQQVLIDPAVIAPQHTLQDLIREVECVHQSNCVSAQLMEQLHHLLLTGVHLCGAQVAILEQHRMHHWQGKEGNRIWPHMSLSTYHRSHIGQSLLGISCFCQSLLFNGCLSVTWLALEMFIS